MLGSCPRLSPLRLFGTPLTAPIPHQSVSSFLPASSPIKASIQLHLSTPDPFPVYLALAALGCPRSPSPCSPSPCSRGHSPSPRHRGDHIDECRTGACEGLHQHDRIDVRIEANTQGLHHNLPHHITTYHITSHHITHITSHLTTHMAYP